MARWAGALRAPLQGKVEVQLRGVLVAVHGLLDCGAEQGSACCCQAPGNAQRPAEAA